MTDIFISYSLTDKDFAASLYQELRRFNVRGFLDQTDLAAGADLSRALRDAVKNADALVVVLSESAANSSFVLAEVGMAQGLGKPILPVLAPGELYERAVPPQLLDRLVIDAGRTPLAEVAAKVVAAATNTSVDAALSQVNSRAQQRLRRLAFVSLILGVLALTATALAVVAYNQRNIAIAAQREAEVARERILSVTSQGSLALAPDGKTAAVGGMDGSVRLFDLHSGDLVSELRFDAGLVNSLAYSPDGRILAVAAGHEIRLWDVATGRQIIVLRGHTDEILAIQFSPDGQRLVSRSIDGTVRVWDVSTGHTLELFRVSK